MDITGFFDLFIKFSVQLFNLLFSIRFTWFGWTIDLWSFIIMMLVISAVISVLWRGAKS